MSGNSGPLNSNRLVLIMLVAIVLVMGATVALNGTVSAPVDDSADESEIDNQSTTESKLLGNNSYGGVTKISGIGNPVSDIRVAFIVGVDQKSTDANSIVPTLESQNGLNYCYDVYIINTTRINPNNSNSNDQSNLTVNEMSENLASEFVVPDIINNNYNFTMDIHSTNDSNSYVFVPSDNTYTSKIVVESISNNTNVGRYTPEKHTYTEDISETIIDYEIPSIVYVSREYYANGISEEVGSIINAIDTFDFVGLFSSDSSVDDSTSSNSSGNSTDYENTVVPTSGSSGNKEVN